MTAPRPTLTLTEAAAVITAAGFGPQPPGVGFELEWFVTRDGVAVTDVDLMRDAIGRDGTLPAASRVTFEPGGQVEISTPPAADGPTALAAATVDADAVATRLAAAGLDRIAVGVDAGPRRRQVLTEPRYTAMDSYFAGLGSAGATMMCATASLQVNVGYTQDAETQWSVAHDLAPVLGAVFANSPLIDGRPSGWQSSRLAVWAALDPRRTGPVPPDAAPSDAWVDYALDAPVMLVHTAHGCTVPRPAPTLRQWIEHGHPLGFPEVADVEYHLTTLFPPVRPRGWLELRMLDALPRPWWAVAGAVTVTALTHPDVRRRVARHVRGLHTRWLDAAWRGVHEPDLAAAAGRVLDEVLPALGPAGYDADLVMLATEFADRYPRRGRSVADDLLDEWGRSGAVSPEPEPVPVGS